MHATSWRRCLPSLRSTFKLPKRLCVKPLKSLLFCLSAAWPTSNATHSMPCLFTTPKFEAFTTIKTRYPFFCNPCASAVYGRTSPKEPRVQIRIFDNCLTKLLSFKKWFGYRAWICESGPPPAAHACWRAGSGPVETYL